jgi:hypothetical protein
MSQPGRALPVPLAGGPGRFTVTRRMLTEATADDLDAFERAIDEWCAAHPEFSVTVCWKGGAWEPGDEVAGWIDVSLP